MSVGAPQVGTFTERTAEASTNVPYPATVPAGALLVLVGGLTTTGAAVTNPAGWTQKVNTSVNAAASSPAIFMAIKYAAGTEGGTTIAVTHTSVVSAWQILAFPGVDQTTAEDVALSVIDSAVSANTVIPSQTIVTVGAAQVAVGVLNTTNSTATPPAGFTETGDRGTGGRSFEVSYITGLATGASGTRTIAWTASARSYGILLALRPGVLAASLSDSAPATDSVARAVALARALADVAAAVDATAGSSTRARAVADTAAASDSVAALVTRGRAIADSAPATDATSRSAIAFARAVNDAGAGTDSLARSSTRSRSTSDTAAAADVVARTSTRSRSTSDTAAASDVVSRLPAFARAAGDTAAAADAVARVAAHPRGLADSAPAIDSTVPTGAGGLSRSCSDSAPATDSTTRSRTSSRAAADSAPATDATVARRALLRLLGDNAAAADLAARAAAYARTALDTALGVDQVAGVVSSVGDLEPAPPERTYVVAGRSGPHAVSGRPGSQGVPASGRVHIVVAQPRRYRA